MRAMAAVRPLSLAKSLIVNRIKTTSYTSTKLNDIQRHVRSISARANTQTLRTYSPSDDDSNVLPMVPWNKEKVNNVYLTGNVGKEVFLRRTPQDVPVARFNLAVDNLQPDGTSEADWFEVELWREKAELAARYLKVGAKVQIQGKVRIDQWTSNEGLPRTSVKVICSEFFLVEPYDASTAYQGRSKKSEAGNVSEDRIVTTEEKWKDFFEDPENWWDNRENKPKSTYPDFKRKTPMTRYGRPEALWIDSRDKPVWVDDKLLEMFGYDDEDR